MQTKIQDAAVACRERNDPCAPSISAPTHSGNGGQAGAIIHEAAPLDQSLEPFCAPGSRPSLRIGLFGIGLEAYWPQFKGLKERLEGYLGVVQERLQRDGVTVVNLGLIDRPPKALEAGHRFRQQDVDLIFLYVTTYALSSTVLPVVQRAKVPVIVLNLQPTAAIDYASFNRMGDRTAMTGEWLAHCGSCPVPEIANVFNRARINFHQITGMLHDDPS